MHDTINWIEYKSREMKCDYFWRVTMILKWVSVWEGNGIWNYTLDRQSSRTHNERLLLQWNALFLDKHFSRSISIRELFFHHESFVYGEYEDEKGESHEDVEGTCLYFIEIISQMCRNFICETLSVVILMSAIHVSWKLERRLHYLQIHLITNIWFQMPRS